MSNFFNLSAKLDMDKDKIILAHGVNDKGRVQKVIDSEVIRMSDKLVPFDTGILKNSASLHTDIGSGEVIYQTPYARKQYYIPMQHTGGRTELWFEHMKQNGGKEQILNIAKREANKD